MAALEKKQQTRQFRRSWFLFCGWIIIGYLLLRIPAWARIPFGEVLREINVHLVPIRCLGLQKLSGDYSVVYFPRGREEEAKLVLKGAERFFPEVAAVFGVNLERQVPVVICREQEELNRLFGWPADEGTMGVYWAGTVWVAGPSSWLETVNGDVREEEFFRSGPIVHEAAHLMVDYQTRGNYPRWLTEGLAQEVERRLAGFSVEPPQVVVGWYPFSMLERFDSLPDQRVAYYQSFLMVQYLLRHGGEAGLTALLGKLGQGQSFDRALEEVMGYGVSEFEARFFRSLSQ